MTFWNSMDLLHRAIALGMDVEYNAQTQLFHVHKKAAANNYTMEPENFARLVADMEALRRRDFANQQEEHTHDFYNFNINYNWSAFGHRYKEETPAGLSELIGELRARRASRERRMRNNIRVLLASGEWETRSPAMDCPGCGELVRRIPHKGLVDADGKDNHACKGRKRPAGTAVVHQPGATPAAHP